MIARRVHSSVQLWLILLMLGLANSVQANQQLDAFYQATQSLDTAFEQTLQGQAQETSRGRLRLSRPDKFILNYTTPSEQSYISNGRTLWIYDVELEQVSIKALTDQVGDSPALLLSSQSNLYQHYHVTDINLTPDDDTLVWVQLQAKTAEMTFERVRLAFNNNVLMQMIMDDSFGQQTTLKFFNMHVNKPLANRVFNFVPPVGVDVIGSARD